MKVLPDPDRRGRRHATPDTQTDTATPARSRLRSPASTTTEDHQTSRPASSSARARRCQHVEGHAYAEITAGARDGMFINRAATSATGRRSCSCARTARSTTSTGPARTVSSWASTCRREDRDRHSGADRRHRQAEDRPSDIKLRKGEKIEPVEGHAYAEITSGPRSGMYINTSGNARRGEAFVLVEKSGFDYHIYGSGDDRDGGPREQARRRGQVAVRRATRAADSSGGISVRRPAPLRHHAAPNPARARCPTARGR